MLKKYRFSLYRKTQIQTYSNTIINTKTQSASARAQLVKQIHAKMQTRTVAQAKKYKHTGKEIQTHRQKDTKQTGKKNRQRNANTQAMKYKHTGKNTNTQTKKYKHTGKEIQTCRQRNTNTRVKKYKHAGKTDIQAKKYKHTGKKMQTERQKTTNIRAKKYKHTDKNKTNTGANLFCCFLVTTDGAQH